MSQPAELAGSKILFIWDPAWGLIQARFVPQHEVELLGSKKKEQDLVDVQLIRAGEQQIGGGMLKNT